MGKHLGVPSIMAKPINYGEMLPFFWETVALYGQPLISHI
jgi:hypothetical protein